MRLLLDSNIVFWVMLGSERLSAAATATVNEPTNQCLISPVNYWEMAMKISVGGYAIDGDFESMWQQVTDRFAVLPIEPKHAARLIDLPFHHRDPFDRMLIAQAIAEQIPVVSSDKQFDAYDVRRVW